MSDMVRYRLVSALIDGPDHPNGAEVELRVLAKVEIEGLTDGMGGMAKIRTLRMADWAGPRLLEGGFAGVDPNRRRLWRCEACGYLLDDTAREWSDGHEDGDSDDPGAVLAPSCSGFAWDAIAHAPEDMVLLSVTIDGPPVPPATWRVEAARAALEHPLALDTLGALPSRTWPG